MPKEQKIKVLVSLPRNLLTQVDNAADRQRRDRSAEMALRLAKTFPAPKRKTATA
ncbi:MAG: hypothetical protein ACK4F4_07280 [Hylemonella sp.]|uniref:hypothetical protein n=1 Tax=Hylemonella sp. TaxID=2066020 RepID=UPI003918E662